jgi:L-ascorbate metabolism protein UlaG (beta-lactamase superfamily)
MILRVLGLLFAAVLALAGTAEAQTPGKVELLWYSQAAFKMTTVNGKTILIDPWITGAPLTPPELKNLDSAIGKPDLVLVTHGHGDHLGDAIDIVKKFNIPMWAPAGLNQELQTLGILPANLAPRMSKGGTIEPFPGVKITMVHADHSSEMILKDPATGKDTSYAAGEPCGFIIKFENGFTIWHMGDTAVFGDMKLISEMYKPDLILIPIGGHFVMDPKDAAYATTQLIKPKMAWPIHYASNPFLKGTPAEFKAALGNSPVQMIDAKPGTKMSFPQ